MFWIILLCLLLISSLFFGLYFAIENKKKSAISRELDNKNEALGKDVLKLATENSALKMQIDEKEKSFKMMQEQLSGYFKNIATDILDNNAKKLTSQNSEKLDKLLLPLSQQIRSFKSRVDEINSEDTKRTFSLIQQIKDFKELNIKVSQEANNLTKALKGEVKTQGDWGEMLLERLLEYAGLQKGIHFFVQQTVEGQRPDIRVKLPDEKFLIIDSKVSLISFERWINSKENNEKKAHFTELKKSLQKHIDDLHKKAYHLKSNSPDYVFMFIPIEPAFIAITSLGENLYRYAIEKNVVLVSTTSLIATMRTISYIWKQENQSKNASEIAKQAGNLYDKFVGFLEDFTSIKDRLRQADNSYENALNKLSTGRGNIVGRVENIKLLGAKASKQLPKNLIEQIEQTKNET